MGSLNMDFANGSAGSSATSIKNEIAKAAGQIVEQLVRSMLGDMS